MSDNYYIDQYYKIDRANIKKWLSIALLKRVFGGAPDTIIIKLRKITSENPKQFPFKEIVKSFRGEVKNFSFDDDEIDNLLTAKYGNSRTFSILAMLYPTLDYRNLFHLDHIFPRSSFTRKRLLNAGVSEGKIDFYLENVDSVLNIQLLEGIPNIQKSDSQFKKWLDETYKTEVEKDMYNRVHYIPKVDLDITNFEELIIEREQLLKQALKQTLQ